MIDLMRNLEYVLEYRKLLQSEATGEFAQTYSIVRQLNKTCNHLRETKGSTKIFILNNKEQGILLDHYGGVEQPQ